MLPDDIEKMSLEGASNILICDFYKLQAPSGPKNENWLKQNRHLRTGAQRFWNAMKDKVWKDLETSSFDQDQIDQPLEIISASSSAEHLEAVAKEE